MTVQRHQKYTGELRGLVLLLWEQSHPGSHLGSTHLQSTVTAEDSTDSCSAELNVCLVADGLEKEGVFLRSFERDPVRVPTPAEYCSRTVSYHRKWLSSDSSCCPEKT